MRSVYDNYRRRGGHSVICVKCEVKICIKLYQLHLKQAHNINTLYLCTWCLQFKWKRSAGSQYNHKYECMLARIKADNVAICAEITTAARPSCVVAPTPRVHSPIPDNDMPVVFSMEMPIDFSQNRGQNDMTVLPGGLMPITFTTEPGTDLWANNKIIDKWMNVDKEKRTRAIEGRPRLFHESFYESLGAEYNSGEEPIFDQTYNLLSKYVCEFNEYSYDHWSVRGSAWVSFVELWEANLKAICTLLPYWCCCDGGKEQHRHMIARYLKNDAEKVKGVWKKICNGDKTALQAKFRKPITTRMHLINAITYVSNEASQCKSLSETFESINDFYNQTSYHGFKAWTKNQRKRGCCHFNIACPTPPFTGLFMSLLYEGGFQKWLTCMYGNCNLERLFATVERVDGKWQILLEHLTKERGIVVPLRRQLEFSWYVGACVSGIAGELYLKPGVKVYLTRNVELTKLDRRSWNQYQLDRGNAMMENVSESLFMLGKKHQEILNILHVQVTEKDRIIREKDRINVEKDRIIREKDLKLYEKEQQLLRVIEEKDQQLRDKEDFIKEIIRMMKSDRIHTYT